VAGLQRLISVAGRNSEAALATWQGLKAQCDEALMKLALLKEHCERYRDLLKTNLGEGMPAISTMTYLGFIDQIEQVVQRQQAEVGRLEAACSRQWQQLVEVRREKRVYELVHERAVERELATLLRRSQAEIDDLLQRVNKAP
jgi:flagellar export protein FliJ